MQEFDLSYYFVPPEKERRKKEKHRVGKVLPTKKSTKFHRRKVLAFEPLEWEGDRGRGRGWKTLVDGLSIDPVFQFSWRNSLDAWCPELRLFRLLRPGAGNLADRIDEKFRPRLPPFSSSCEHL